MYIIKNALRCIGRSKGRNILIGIIVLVISVSACIGLSIRQASENAKQDTLDNMSITATISFDRQSMMSEMGGGFEGERGERPSFDRDQFAQMMGGSQALSLEEYEVYAGAESVKDFYYVSTVSVNGSEDLLPVSTENESEEDTSENSDDMSGGFNFGGGPGGFGGGGMGMKGMNQSDFTLKGYSSDSAMTAFQDGTASITDGSVFEEGTASLECIISEELALYNSLAVGDTIVITNPNNEEETYELAITGLFTDSSANENSFSPMGFSSSDPANMIYLSYNALESIVSASEASSETVTDETTGREYETALATSLEATYVLADTDAYYRFEEDVRDLGLDESYVVNSMDITAFENSLTPLKTLSSMAGWFLLIILIIGAVILVVLNIFSVRERKYEIGVLTAMGMKKGKVALQFITEIFMVTIVSVIIGVLIGGVASVPVTNALLEHQATAQSNRMEEVEMNFGRPGGFGGGGMPDKGNIPEDIPQRGDGFGGMFMQAGDAVGSYVTEINSAMNLTVVLQMFGIAVLLTLFAGAASLLFIMRYEPLKILANRD
ncbi:MAG: ABC transporter permease [Ruminococcus sp.]|nr:ABC transporter permease [Ruminococcus sp.]